MGFRAGILRTMKFSIVTVTYPAEYPLLLLQARSIVKYVERADLEQVVFIRNCDWTTHENDHFFFAALSVLEDAGIEVRIISRAEFRLDPKYTAKSGWKDQQALKLLVARKLSVPHYLLLDSKNFLTRPVGSERLLPCGRAVTFTGPVGPAMKDHLDTSFRAMGLQAPPEGSPVMPTATPYMMNRGVVLDLLHEIGEPFEAFFYKEFRITEFFTYFAFLTKYDLITKHYTSVRQFYATFFAVWPTTPEHIAKVEAAVDSEPVFAAGVHRKRFAASTPEFRAYLTALWARHSLVRTPEEAGVVFDAVVSTT